MRGGQNTNISRNLEDVSYNSQGQLWEVQDFSKGSTADMIEIARELELAVEDKVVIELQQPHDKSLWMSSSFLWWAKKEFDIGI